MRVRNARTKVFPIMVLPILKLNTIRCESYPKTETFQAISLLRRTCFYTFILNFLPSSAVPMATRAAQKQRFWSDVNVTHSRKISTERFYWRDNAFTEFCFPEPKYTLCWNHSPKPTFFHRLSTFSSRHGPRNIGLTFQSCSLSPGVRIVWPCCLR